MAELKLSLEKHVKVTDHPTSVLGKDTMKKINAEWDKVLKAEVDDIEGNSSGGIFLDDHVQLYRDVSALLL